MARSKNGEPPQKCYVFALSCRRVSASLSWFDGEEKVRWWVKKESMCVEGKVERFLGFET
jgi:hypothetical protein